MTFDQTRLPHRASRRAMRRQLVLRRMFLVLSALLISGAFVGGFRSRQAKSDNNSVLAGQPAVAEASREHKAEALCFFDEAVRARYEGRLQGAMNSVTAARRLDPQIKGIDSFIGEVAIEQKDLGTVRQAADRAFERGESKLSAHLFYAFEAWMQRGHKGTERAGATAKQALLEAAQEEPSNASSRVFLGELHRMLGDGSKAARYLRAALLRQEPWQSYDTLAIKFQLTVIEAEVSSRLRAKDLEIDGGGSVSAAEIKTNLGKPVISVRLVASTTALQLRELLSDSAFSQADFPEDLPALLQRAVVLPE